MNLSLSNLTKRTLQLLLLITVLEFCLSAPRRQYNYANYNPYRNARSTQKTGINYYRQLFSYPGVSLRSQRQIDREKVNENKNRVSKADAENAKFAGLKNQEADEESVKTLGLLNNRNRFRQPLASPCFRDASANEPKGQGRFLFDLNVYNVYPNGGFNALSDPCGGYGGGGLLGGAGGLLSNALADAIAPPPTPLENFLTLFAPGILQNSLAATVRPRPQIPLQSDPIEADTDPAVDPEYNAPRPQIPVRRPNRVYFDSAGPTPITPAQLIGGVATTVNGIIQQLTGNIQPVYPAYG